MIKRRHPTPKRHHWWPESHIQFWLNEAGNIHLFGKNGLVATPSGKNIALESKLYTGFSASDAGVAEDVQIETWLARDIEPDIAPLIRFVASKPDLVRHVGNESNLSQSEGEEVGILTDGVPETISFPRSKREALARYLASLVVRSPHYLAKIRSHIEPQLRDVVSPSGLNLSPQQNLQNSVLSNMLHVYELYAEALMNAEFLFAFREGNDEFIFGDGGVHVREPWNKSALRFDIYAPLTPDISVTAIAVPQPQSRLRAIISRAGDKLVRAQNRLTLSLARRFIFARSLPDQDFVAAHFGKPADKQVAMRWTGDRVEVRRVSGGEAQGIPTDC